MQDQVKYKAMLRQIGRLNGILPEDVHPEAGLKQTTRRRTKSLSPKKRRTKTKLASIGKEASGFVNEKPSSAKTGDNFPAQTEPPYTPAPPLHSAAPAKNIPPSPVQDSYSHHHRLARGVTSNESSNGSTEKIGGTLPDDRAGRLFQTYGARLDRERSSESGPIRPHTRPRSIAEITNRNAFNSTSIPGKLSR